MTVPRISESGTPEVFVGYCEEHGEFHFHEGGHYCPVVRERWGRMMRCNGMARNVRPLTLAFAHEQLQDVLAQLQEFRP